MSSLILNKLNEEIVVPPGESSITAVLFGLQGQPNTLSNRLLSFVNRQTLIDAVTVDIGTSETLTGLVSNPVATRLGCCYRIIFSFELRSAQDLTNYATARVRRGISTSGTPVQGPTTIAKRAGTASRDLITVIAYDIPGLQSSQRWCLSLQTDSGTVDVYNPSFVAVEYLGLYSETIDPEPP